MKATIEFTLPEEQEDFQIAVNAYKYKMSLEDFDSYLRARLKYEDIPDERIYQCIQDIRNKLHAVINENEISIL